MACYHPLQGYKSRRLTPRGKRAVVFNKADGYVDLPVAVPCGQCIGCRVDYTREWALRCMHEASMHEDNTFVTLTYDDAHIPPFQSLRREDFVKFIKRLRRSYDGVRFKYFGCGEYGDETHRPHYHCLLFGLSFVDQVYLATRGKYRVFKSQELERIWQNGLCEIGSVTFESAQYVARYIWKKVKGDEETKRANYEVCDSATGEIVERESEFASASRRPALGKEWYLQFGDEVAGFDTVIYEGYEVPVPKYYDRLLENVDPDKLEKIKRKRRARRDEENSTEERLCTREKVHMAKVNIFSGGEL